MTSKTGTSRLLAAACLGGALAAAACVEPPVIDYTNRAPPPPLKDFGDRDPVVPVLPDGTATFTGQVKNWVSLQTVDGITVKTYGLNPPVQGSADAAGGFSLQVQAAGVFWVYAYKDGYAYTYDFVQMPAGDYNKTLYVVSEADLDSMAATYGVTRNPACATVVGEVRDPANQGQDGIEGVTIQGGVEYAGPYFLNDQGQAQQGLTYTSLSGRVVFFNVCDTGAQTLTEGKDVQITVVEAGYGAQPQLLKLFPGAVTRGVVKVTANAPPPPPPDPVVIDFPAEIYPIFVNNACAACHVAGGAAGGTGLYFDGPAEEVYALLREGTARVNLNYPEQSTVLTKPLLEEPADHPNASFTSVEHPDYVALLNWINQGAPYGVNEPPPLVEPVDFYSDVYGVLQVYDAQNYPYGRGCANCHNATDYSGNLDLTGGAQVVFQRLVDKNLYDVNYPDRSKILRNPYCGPTKCANDPQYPETHPTEVFATTNDPDYQTLYQWVSQGAVYQLNPEPPPPVLPTNVDFFDNVQPRFAQRGCIGCHNAVELDGNLDLTGLPNDVYQRLTNPQYQRVVPNDYEGSYLYTKPNAAYPDVNHGGGKPIPNADDDFARYVAGWIYEGAVFQNPGPMNFANAIVPLLGANGLGCTGCHNQAQQAGGLALDGTPEQVYAELTVEEQRVVAGDPANSPLLMKAFDLYPNVNHNGGKKAIQTYYKEYHRLATWIFEGALP